MTLFQIKILSYCFYGLTGLSFLLLLVKFLMLRKKAEPDGQTEQVSTTKPSLVTWKVIFAVFAIMAMSLSLFHGWLYKSAIDHGAYGDDIEKSETVTSVMNHHRHGFIDQSAELPEDLSGCLVIMFKYGCIDCTDTHDQIVATMDQYSDPDLQHRIYTVSSTTEVGKKLIEEYDVEAVPSGIYVYNDPSGRDQPYVTKVLYDIFEKDNPAAKFLPNELKELLSLQNRGR